MSGQNGPVEYVAGLPEIVKVAQVATVPPLNVQFAVETSPVIAPSAKCSSSNEC